MFQNFLRKLALRSVRKSPPEGMAVSQEEVDGLPEPYKGILFARDTTTKSLEGYMHGELKATIYQKQTRGELLSRAVCLETPSGEVVSLGLSTVNPRVFPEAYDDLVRGEMPLGKLIEKYSLKHRRISASQEATASKDAAVASIRKFDDNLATRHLLGAGPYYGRTYTIFRGTSGNVYMADITELFSNRLLSQG